MKYRVTFSKAYIVEAEDEKAAADKAQDLLFDEIDKKDESHFGSLSFLALEQILVSSIEEVSKS